MAKPKIGRKASALGVIFCAAIAYGLRADLTSLMSLHMLVQIPLLVLLGVFAQQFSYLTSNSKNSSPSVNSTDLDASSSVASKNNNSKTKNKISKKSWSFNEYGLPGLLFVSLVGAYWMVPKALDDALVDWRVAAFKYIGLPICGYLLMSSIRKSNVVIKVFFLGNFCWMSAIVGMVYMDQPVRLCNAYLQSDQDWAGRGLIALAIILPLSWLIAEIKPIWRFLNRH